MITVLPVKNRCDKKHFINFPYHLYRHDPAWVPPLKLERHDFLNPQKNPFFHNAEVALFVARKNGETVGRISAQINRLHNERYQEKTGHFGFFDCIDDAAIAHALLKTAEDWLKSRGMNQAIGPMSLSINEEVGLLIEGFDKPPYPYMAHNLPYYAHLVESAGYGKIKDLIAWNYDATRPVPETALQIANVVKEYPGLVVREVDMKNMERELRIISDVFNSAWAKNWGFIPWTDEEIQKSAKDFKMILNPKLALIAEINGVPAAISIAIPNYHEAIRDLKGRLFPWGLFRFLFRLKTGKIKSSRLCLLGIKKEFRHDILAGLSVYLYTEMHKRGQALGHWGGELSWTLEDNDKINNGIALMGGEPYKKYRVYSKELT